MAGPFSDAMSRQIETLFRSGTLAGLGDAQLLERFLRSEDSAEAAFGVLIDRHGPMVHAVCRRILRDDHAADDAFQATILILVRRAGAIRRAESLGPWLHGVARRVALQAKAAATRRREREARAAIAPQAAEALQPTDDLGALLHDEIDRLPEKYRAPVVLCCLEGRTIDEASRLLGWPVGTVGGRLARARDRLRGRFVRRGLAVPSILMALAWDEASASALPQGLARSSLRSALDLAAGVAATDVVPATVADLLGEAFGNLMRTRLIIGAWTLTGTLALGAAVMALQPSPDPTPPPRTSPAPAPAGGSTAAALRRASEFDDSAFTPQEQVDLEVSLARAQIKTGDLAGAKARLERAEQAARALKPDPRARARVLIAWAWGRAGDRGRGLTLLKWAVKDAEQTKHFGNKTSALKWIAQIRVELGDMPAARQALEAQEQARREKEGETLGAESIPLIETLLALGDVDAAFQTAEAASKAIKSRKNAAKWHARVMTNIATETSDGNRWSETPREPMTPEERAAGLEVVRRAWRVVETLPDVNDHLTMFAAAFSELGDDAKALEFARRIDQSRILDKDEIDATWALWRISMAQVKAGRLDAARSTVREASRVAPPPNANRNKLRNLLAGGYLVTGDIAEALNKAEDLEALERAAVRSQAAKRRRRVGDRAEADRLLRQALADVERWRAEPPPAEPPPERRHRVDDEGKVVEVPPEDVDPKQRHEARALAAIALIHARAGDGEAAARAFAAIPLDDEERRYTATLIAAIRAHSGDVDEALAWSRSLTTPAQRAAALLGVGYGIYEEMADLL